MTGPPNVGTPDGEVPDAPPEEDDGTAGAEDPVDGGYNGSYALRNPIST